MSNNFVEFLSVGLNLCLVLAFIAWRFWGRGKPYCRDTESKAIASEGAQTIK